MQSIWEGRSGGKAILAGEHAVVYGQPAVSIPVSVLSARAELRKIDGRDFQVEAPVLELDESLTGTSKSLEPFRLLRSLAASHFERPFEGLRLTVSSDLPFGRGLGSGAAVSAAVLRAFFACTDSVPTPEELDGLVHEVEKLYHGRPSGIDSATVVYGRPVFLSSSLRCLEPAPFTFILADSGPAPATRAMIEQVARTRGEDSARTEKLFAAIGDIARETAVKLEKGGTDELGDLLNRNHALLVDLGVSTKVLDRLCCAACNAGAAGAKLTGAGGGGFLMALAAPEKAAGVMQSLRALGARTVTRFEVG
jgi:mevalonate kinase